MIESEEIRKGPWTEQEDVQLNFYVKMFGDRRWDFIAKVSGLKRTGKSCRLRWVNYMHPGLKRDKLTPQEEKLVLELHSKWGNRWSKIARKLPGRTDNEIKNYWRTHMRKIGQEKKKTKVTSGSVSNTSSSSFSLSPVIDSNVVMDFNECNFYDTGGLDMVNGGVEDMTTINQQNKSHDAYPMDEIWKDIERSAREVIKPVNDGPEEGSSLSSTTIMGSPIWDYYPDDNLWNVEDQLSSPMAMPLMSEHFDSFHSSQENVFRAW